MTEPTPSACSLDGDQLNQRIATIAEIGAESLVSRDLQGSHHVLHFRASPGARKRLEGLIAAEKECCSFLDLMLEEQGDELILWVGAPLDAEALADGLASAFGQPA